MKYDSITHLSGLDGVRRNLSMYIGGTGVGENGEPPRALIQMFQEILSNSLDEYHSGFGNQIRVTIHEDNSLSIQDNGRGIPAGKKFIDAINAFTKSHSSGKFDAAAYATGSTGMHGIGAKAVNAASEWMTVESHREEISYLMKLSKGNLVDVNEIPFAGSTGTLITFKPDTGSIDDDNPKPVLESDDWDISLLEERCKIAAFLNPGVEIILNDNRDPEYREKIISYPKGIPEYLSNGDIESVLYSHGIVEIDGYEFAIDVAMIPSVRGSIKSFANGIRTIDGGYHEDGLRQAIGRAFSQYSGKKLAVSDVLESAKIIVHVQIHRDIIEFEGQTKEKLGTSRARQAVSQFISSQFLDVAYDNKEISDKIVEKALAAAADREAMEKAREAQKKLRESSKVVNGLSISSKLKTASSRNPAEKELIITEGDSASGIPRDPRTQAIMPLRGKPKNVLNVSLAEALSNKEISTLMSVMGAGVLHDFDVKKAQYGKVILACDADVDGSHIRALLIGMFFKLCPGLIEAGMLYVVDPPLYKAVKYVKNEPHVVFMYDDIERAEKMKELEDYELRRFKGLGEMSPEEAASAISNPATRRLRQVTCEDFDAASKTLSVLLGDELNARRDWVLSNIEF